MSNVGTEIPQGVDQVYDLFCREKLLDLLDSDYEDLHGMGKEYLMHFFDEYLKGVSA